ncbi:4Fe-4S binding protein [Miniphocaeibacter halophilus]|uniref:4Fe-4S binding protein n=1 Tax=Miniphocaeibacter halophilus TaxID=2931922 RepID=A0AC61N2P2_9FIRM|nr:4Fe-4S binding protein [Miniphocaeibacter halophilus]QQK09151.1 4Fe-4S binding protein [Miniphocaeibacter halophilus]
MYEFLGVEIQSPIIIGSGPLTYSAEGIKKLHENKAGLCVTKTIKLEAAVNPVPHMQMSENKSLINDELWSDYNYETWINKELPELKKSGIPVIASCGHSVEETSLMVEKLEKEGATFLELVSYNEDDLLPMLLDTKKRVNIPIIVKLPSRVNNMVELAKTLEENGADALTISDSIGPAMRINIDTGLSTLGNKSKGWLTGEAILPFNINNIYEVRKNIEIPIIGLGGVMSYKNAIEVFMAGANFVGVCTYPIIYGEKAIEKLVNQIEKWIVDNNYNSLEEIIGLIHRKTESIVGEFKFNKDKCIKCKKCEIVCAYDARKVSEDMYLDKSKCRKCGLCSSICPTTALEFY